MSNINFTKFVNTPLKANLAVNWCYIFIAFMDDCPEIPKNDSEPFFLIFDLNLCIYDVCWDNIQTIQHDRKSKNVSSMNRL